jgi:hypothetical protein
VVRSEDFHPSSISKSPLTSLTLPASHLFSSPQALSLFDKAWLGASARGLERTFSKSQVQSRLIDYLVLVSRSLGLT